MPEILIEGREAMPDERTRSALQLQKAADAAGWITKIGYSQFKDDDKTFKSGAKAGQTVEGKIVDNVWCQGFKEGKVFTATWCNNKLDHVLYGNQLIDIKSLKEMFKDANGLV